jgi:SMI1-KNR4 cell-wall
MPSYSSIEIQIDHLFGIGHNIGILDTLHFQEEWNLLKGLVLISGDGHEWIALDYTNSKTCPPIVHVDSEEETITTIASSFNEFLTHLMGSTINNVRIKKLSPSTTDQDFYHKVDKLMIHGTPKSIDQFFSKVISTNKNHIDYMVDKMWRHPNPKVQFYLMLYLSECAEGNNQGMIHDDKLYKMLIDIMLSKDTDAQELAEYSLAAFSKRNN